MRCAECLTASGGGSVDTESVHSLECVRSISRAEDLSAVTSPFTRFHVSAGHSIVQDVDELTGS